jgi:hypothetical protein
VLLLLLALVFEFNPATLSNVANRVGSKVFLSAVKQPRSDARIARRASTTRLQRPPLTPHKPSDSRSRVTSSTSDGISLTTTNRLRQHDDFDRSTGATISASAPPSISVAVTLQQQQSIAQSITPTPQQAASIITVPSETLSASSINAEPTSNASPGASHFPAIEESNSASASPSPLPSTAGVDGDVFNASTATQNQESMSMSVESSLWEPRSGPVEPAISEIVSSIVASVRSTEEWDRGWMLVLQAILRRRSKEWFADPAVFGGLFIPDASALVARLRSASNFMRPSCYRADTTLIAAVMLRNEGRFIQEWMTWHLFTGFNHFLVYLEDPDDGTLLALQPFIGAGVASVFFTADVPGVAAAVAEKANQAKRQQAVYDHALLSLQKVACRYRGRGGLSNVAECSSSELRSYYGSRSDASFVNPYERRAGINGSFLAGPEYLANAVWRNAASLRGKSGDAAEAVISPTAHGLWLAPLDSDEFFVVNGQQCLPTVLHHFRASHPALGVPWTKVVPNGVLQPRDTLLLQSLTRRRREMSPKGTMKYIVNVQFAVALDIHFPILQTPHVMRDEGGNPIDTTLKEDDAHVLHNWGSNKERRVSLLHFHLRSLEAAVFKGARQVVDDVGAGNIRSTATMLDFLNRALIEESLVVHDTATWLGGRQFMLTVLFGPLQQSGSLPSVSQYNATSVALSWSRYWEPVTVALDPAFRTIVSGIMSAVSPRKEWDRGWMLVLQAVMRRRAKEWFSDPAAHGGLFLRDADTLSARLALARASRKCAHSSLTLVAAVMVRNEGRYIQEWLTWHLQAGYSHFLVYYDDPEDGTLSALRPFIDAGLVTPFHTLKIPDVAEAIAAKSSQVRRQQACFDHALLLLQKTACRYRGSGSPLSVELCSYEELQNFYGSAGKQKYPGPCVDPYDRARPVSKRTAHLSDELVGASWLELQVFKAVNGKVQEPPPSANRTLVQQSVPFWQAPHHIWLAVADSDEFMVTADGSCMTSFIRSIQATHVAVGAPWREFFPNSVLEPSNSLLTWNLTRTRRLQRGSVTSRRGDIQGTKSMPKYLTNVRA